MLSVIVSFFSPCDYALPRRHFADAVRRLVDAGMCVIVTQAVCDGRAPVPVPSGVAQYAEYHGAEPMFLKENLWNLGAAMADPQSHLAFLDADVSLPSWWWQRTEDTLEHADVCQPFAKCRWMDRSGTVFREMRPSALAIERGKAPWHHRYHPGFGIAIRRDAYDRLGGIYERFPSGGGDLAFWLAMSTHPETETIAKHKGNGNGLNTHAPTYVAYRANALSLNLRVAAVPGVTATHPWHGDRENRLYTTRETFFPRCADGEPAVARRADGLLKYTMPAPNAIDYFAVRKEDG